jgi:hypothetical protein
MSIFDDVSLTWNGEEYKIEAGKIMGAISVIEEVVTLQELAEYATTGKTPLSKLAMAFGAVLRYAGAKVKDEEVYAGMFEGTGQGSAIASLSVLLSMMIPQTVVKNPKEEAAPTGGSN